MSPVRIFQRHALHEQTLPKSAEVENIGQKKERIVSTLPHALGYACKKAQQCRNKGFWAFYAAKTCTFTGRPFYAKRKP